MLNEGGSPFYRQRGFQPLHFMSEAGKEMVAGQTPGFGSGIR